MRESGFGARRAGRGWSRTSTLGRWNISQAHRGPEDLASCSIGGAFPRSESAAPRRHRRRTGAAGPRGPGLRARTCATRSRRPGGAAGVGRPHGLYNRAEIVYRIAEVLEGRAAQLADELESIGVPEAAAARADLERRSTRPSTGPAPPTSSTSSWAGSTRSRGRILDLSGTVPLGVCALSCPEDGVRARRAGGGSRRSWPATCVVPAAGGPARSPTSTLGEVIDVHVPGGGGC